MLAKAKTEIGKCRWGERPRELLATCDDRLAGTLAPPK